jgi:enoyl-CoA hydratase/carnithine racemase
VTTSGATPGGGPFDEIAVERYGAVLEIRLNRPDQRNPISARTGGTRDQILAALASAEDDPGVGCVLLTGAGRAFSAGGDLVGNKPRETAAEQAEFLERAEEFHARMRAARLPIVAAVQGHCLGAALTLVASCDLVIAGRSATFGLPEGRLGLVGVTPLVLVVGTQWAKFLIMTGESIDAETAREIGLVLTVEPDDSLHARALDLADRLTRLPREALLLSKRTVDGVAEAAGGAAGRLAGRGFDAVTLANSGRATAPDGRTFRAIIAEEGIDGLKRARAAQYDTPWLTERESESGSQRG